MMPFFVRAFALLLLLTCRARIEGAVGGVHAHTHKDSYSLNELKLERATSLIARPNEFLFYSVFVCVLYFGGAAVLWS